MWTALCLCFSVALALQEDIDYFKKWIDQDVLYIITPEERSVFEKLTTPEEKQAFIEQFWLRRDPTQSTVANEFKEEYYRRIQYANDHFTSGIDGWKTDRGRIYIVYGPPDQRESFPTGGGYQRPLSEGGGRTSTYPFERWFYRHLAGVGEGVEIEFIDPTHSGEYRIARHPGEKDAFLFTPAGKTLYESLGVDTRYDRIARSFSLRDHSGEFITRDLVGVKEKTFQRLQQFFDLRRPPALNFKDLHAQVDARVSYRQFPVQLRHDYFRIDGEHVLVPLTMRIENKDVTYQPVSAGTMRTVVHIYGRVESIQRKVVHEFEDELTSDMPESSLGKGALIYQRSLPLAPGRYKLTMLIKDQQSERISSVEEPIVIPKPEALELGSVILTDNILPMEEGESLPDPFVVPAGVKIYPTTDGLFDAGRSVGIYYEIYGFAVDTASRSPELVTRHRLLQGDRTVYEEEVNLREARSTLSEQRATVIRIMSLKNFGVGDFTLVVEVEDKISGQKAKRSVPFRTS